MEEFKGGSRSPKPCLPAHPNCWEIMECGLEPGGSRAEELGVCPAALPGDDRRDGMNRGVAAGRACWAIEGTLCDRLKAVGPAPAAVRFLACTECPALKEIQEEEGPDFRLGIAPD